jgi:glucokinase
MYVGVDIGGTKTLVATLDDSGVIAESVRFPTPQAYEDFIFALKKVAQSLHTNDFHAGAIAAPGHVDHERGIGTRFGNLPWENVPLREDGEKIFNCPILLENDAKLGGLSESKLLPPDKRVLYITISTGINTGLIHNQRIVPELADSEAGQMQLEYHGQRMSWEDFASGKAIVERFGKKAKDIQDPKVWQRIAHDLSEGFIELIAIMQPDIIVVGGSVGQYLEKYRSFLEQEIKQYNNPLIPIPVIQKAARPEDAVIYGCYDLAHEKYGQTA